MAEVAGRAGTRTFYGESNHLTSLSASTTWVEVLAPDLFPACDPAKGIKELRLPPLEPRALSEAKVRSLKNVCDRLERFHELKGREWKERGKRGETRHARGRPIRDRAIVFDLLSTGVRREELMTLDLGQVQPNEPDMLRTGGNTENEGLFPSALRTPARRTDGRLSMQTINLLLERIVM